MDKDKVIRGLECLTGDRDRYPDPCKGCRYVNLKNYANCVKAIAKDAIILLEEQEAKPVKIVKNAYNHEFYHCPRCDRSFYELFVKPKFCDKCGQEVKWE